LTYNARSADQPGVDKVLETTTSAIWKNPSSDGGDRTIQKVVETEMLKHLMGLAVNDRAYPEVRAKAFNQIKKIKSYANGRTSRTSNGDGIYYQYVIGQIDQFLDDPGAYDRPDPIKAPDGSPIGSCDF